MRDYHGELIHCGDIITNGKTLYEVCCISSGIAYCNRIEIMDNNRFYKSMEAHDFTSYEISQLSKY